MGVGAVRGIYHEAPDMKLIERIERTIHMTLPEAIYVIVVLATLVIGVGGVSGPARN
jgi:ABC-type polysaccharide transport system permease subunit